MMMIVLIIQYESLFMQSQIIPKKSHKMTSTQHQVLNLPLLLRPQMFTHLHFYIFIFTSSHIRTLTFL